MTLFSDDVFNLAAIVHEVAGRDPHRLAVVEPAGHHAGGGRRYRQHSYRQLSRDVESAAAGLRALGIAERTRTVFMAPPSYGACVAAVALTQIGATMLWIDPSVGYRNVGERLGRIDPEAFVGIPAAHLARTVFGWGPRRLDRAVVIGDPGFPGAHRLESLLGTPPRAPVPPAVGPDDVAAIMYTTGSTGPAKPALYRHREMCAIYRQVHRLWRFADGPEVPVDLAAFPAFHTVGLSAGGTVIVPPIDFVRQGPADVDPEALLEVINDCRAQTLFASPVILENLAEHGRTRGVTAPTLRAVIGGGAPLYAEVLRGLRSMIGAGGEAYAAYGATEALPATELAGGEALRETLDATARGAGLCVGRPCDGVEVEIIEIQDGPIASMADAGLLPAGTIGEIVVRGAHVSPAYAGDPESTRRNKIDDGDGGVWHRLGDAGYLDDAGRLWCCGRVSHRVELGDGPLFPLMCEPIFDAHPAVRRSALVGIPAPGGGGAGQTPVLCVEIAGRGRNRDAVRDELLALAARHELTRPIRHVLFRRLPVDPRHNSKIERPALARWAASQLGAARPAGLRARAIGRLRRAALAALLLSACTASADDPAVGVDSGPALPVPGAPDAGAVPPPDAWVDLGAPIEIAPEDLESWVWVPIPEMVCADGTPAGVGVNFTDQSRELVIWFQGNGVCYDFVSCTMFQSLMVGMGDDPLHHLWWGDESMAGAGLFDRNHPDNPFREANFVALPHCSLDGHSADKQSSYPGLPTYEQRGYRNATEALRRIAATFPDASRVTVAGFSAGAIGATANYDKIATTFEALGHEPPFLVADAGPLLRKPYLTDRAIDTLRAGWGLDETVGTWCPDCLTEGPSAIYRTLSERHPGMRASVICTYDDTVVFSLYRLLNYDLNLLDGGMLRRGLIDLDDAVLEFQPDMSPSAQRQFLYPGDRHGAVVFDLTATAGLLPFLEAQLDGDPGWASVRK